MSASKKKKARQELAEQEHSKPQETQKAPHSDKLYAVVGILCLALVVLVLAWNTGIIQRNAAAVTVNGVKYTVADAQYYYNSTKQSVQNFYYSNLGMLPFDGSVSTKDQVYDSETGETWYDYLLGQTLDTMATYDAIEAKAKSEGYTMSAESKEFLDSQLAELQSAADNGGFKDADAYVKAIYGTYLTYDRFAQLFEKSVFVSDYINSVTTGFTYADSDYQAYYEENADALDNYTITQFVFRASVPTTDDNGNAIERTEDEEKAALEQAKAEAKAKAEDIMARLEKGEDAADLAEEYSEDLYSYDISDVRTGSLVNTSYTDWAFDPARRNGDLTLAEYDGSGSYFYYVARFEDRERDDTPTANVRHILVAADTDEGAAQPTEAQYAEAKKKAEELLAQWKAGEATEESFAELAAANSADGGSAADGGLIPNITAESGYIQDFTDWSMDPSRKEGDTGLVKNTGSATKGWHVMYYVASGDPVWKMSADSVLRSEDYAVWEEAVCEGYAAKSGIGLKFLQP